jgi:hypothetical protein
MRVNLSLRASGGARGGRWNAAWRDFTQSRVRATHEEIWSHAAKLIVEFNLAGADMVPYR